MAIRLAALASRHRRQLPQERIMRTGPFLLSGVLLLAAAFVLALIKWKVV